MTRPASLSALLSWYRDEVDAAIPRSTSVGRFGMEHGDIDEDGKPEWLAAFRAWLTAHPGVEADDGSLRSPLRYWMWRMEHVASRRASFLYALACLDFDWRRCAGLWGIINDDAAHDFTRESLRRLHRLMYTEGGEPNEPRRPKLGDCAERGCANKTTRLRCQEHEKAR